MSRWASALCPWELASRARASSARHAHSRRPDLSASEMASSVQGYYPGRFPQSSVIELPLMFGDALSGTRTLTTLFKLRERRPPATMV